MSPSLHTWYSLSDLDVLAQREAVLEGEMELARLTRLTELLNADVGKVWARLAFHRYRDGIVLLKLDCRTKLEFVCQRCLEPLTHLVRERVDFALLETDALTSCSPEAHELVVLGEDRFNPAVLIEDELIVSAPLVPRHATDDQCGRLAQALNESNYDEAREHQLPTAGRPVNH